ncbi:hypothetical protein L1987_42625 [Smallanthus sonchifolius]|uniref:Uncharacterized protein n=1 Tax=Smallanthus sonchifolius TaxID=185202 RepID=A0ACB9GKC2_9ASTR|nr:hypothetical protein L1987_42625 [Smallanthus sonchifolius]
MACLGIRHGGIGDSVIRKHSGGYPDQQSGRVSRFLTIPNLTVKIPNHRVSTAVNAAVTYDSGRDSGVALFDYGLDLATKEIGNSDYNDRTSIESPRVSENLDEWIRNSVTEIVKNIKQAPLLVQIYADGKVKTKKALPETDWKNVAKQRSSALEGVILVEELRRNSDLADSGDDSGEVSGDRFEEDNDGGRAFGVLIQGRIKGRDQCKSTCYLLKTSSVHGGGLGHVCTHFCLMKVQSFHKDAFSQFKDCWMV